MHILVSGGTGFIGSALIPALVQRGDRVTVLTRSARQDASAVRYITGMDELAGDDAVDAVVNLAGASLAAKRWTSAYKQVLRDSRLDTTRQLVTWCETRAGSVPTFLSASAIGYYGHHSDEPLDEQGEVVPGFAQALCSDWESAAKAARDSGARVCRLRLGVVFDAGGGALSQMLASYRLGIGSWVSPGDQWLSWIHRHDVVAAILMLLDDRALAGAFNLTAPEPVTAREASRVMGSVYPTLFSLPLPGAIARVLLGEMAEELLINGQRVLPSALMAAGFRFRYPNLGEALAEIRSR